MSLIINIGSAYRPLQSSPAPPGTPNQAASLAHARERDLVELSGPRVTVTRGVEESTFRVARTRAIRVEIEAGTFETPERINGTVERLLDVIG